MENPHNMRDFKNRKNDIYVSFWPKEKGIEVWGFKRKAGNSQELEKEQMFCKQMFARPYRNNGTQKRILADFAKFLSVYHT